MARENVALTAPLRETPVAPLAGDVLVTVGATGMISIAAITGWSVIAVEVILSACVVMLRLENVRTYAAFAPTKA